MITNKTSNAISLSSAEAFMWQSKVESNARTYARTINVKVTKALGSEMYDAEGNCYIDCLAGAGTLATGHNHPVIVERLKEYLDSGNILHGLDLLTNAKRIFTEKVIKILPANMQTDSKIQFCGPSGADATEAAIKLFKTATGRSSVFSFHGGYHGMTSGALALTGNLAIKEPVASLMPDVHFFPYPYDYRSPYGVKGESLIDVSLHHIRNTLADPESGITKPAAMILEAIQGEGGCVVAPTRWLKGIRDICTEFDIPLILDEIQAGFGRTGKMFAFEHAEIKPDAILISKAVGGGLPMSLVVYNEKYDKWQPGAHTGTFRGNQLGMVSGSATIDLFSEENLLAEAKRKGEWLLHSLEQLKSKYPVIGDVRGKGLMVGIEIINPDKPKDLNGNPQADGVLADNIKKECFCNGLIIETGGRHGAVLRLLPALTISDQQLEVVVSKLEQSINTLTS